MPGKVDHKREMPAYRARAGVFDIVDVPALNYLMIDGHGDPNTSPDFSEAVEALYPLAYGLKFASKRESDRDYTVMPLEGLWWSNEYRDFTSARDKSKWHWTLMIMTPDWITVELVEHVRVRLADRPAAPAALDRVHLETLEEGRCVQTLHLGAFDDEGPVLATMHDEFIPGNGLRMRGIHHEIYLSDRRRVEPAKYRTILRQPVEPA